MHFSAKPALGIAALLALACVSACSSSGSSPVPLVRTPRSAGNAAAPASFSVSIAGFAAQEPQIMNGAQIDIVVSGARNASAGFADAAGTRTALRRGADGIWRASLQYIDELNPPPAHPAIDVAMQFSGGKDITRRIPIVELHE